MSIAKNDDKRAEKSADGLGRKTLEDLKQECLSEMARNGIPLSQLLSTDGKIHRYSCNRGRNKDEWYVAFEGISNKGNPYLNCVYGSWRFGETLYFNSYKKGDALSKEEINFLETKIEEQKKLAEKALTDEREKKVLKAKQVWNSASQVSNASQEYLIRKQVGAHGIKFGAKKFNDGTEENPDWVSHDVLIIPLKNADGDLRAIQYIRADGEKRTNGDKKGNFHLIGEITPDSIILVAEGYSTGVSVHQITQDPLIIAIDCWNLDSVLQNIRKKYPDNKILILGDDDTESRNPKGELFNPGRTKAEAVAKKYNCSVAFPKFPDDFKLSDDKRPTDWNELAVYFGEKEVRKQILPSLEEKKESPSKTFNPLTFEEMLSRPPKEWIIENIAGRSEIGMIYGHPGCGKTFVAIDLCIHACKGKKWASSFNVQRPLNVAYCAGEGASGLPDRFRAASKYHEIDSLDNFTFYDSVPQLYDTQSPEAIERFRNEWPVGKPLDLLILDTFHSASTGAEENSAKDMGKVLFECKRVSKALGCTIVLIHHCGKDGKDVRGSSSIRGALDFSIEVLKSDATRTRTMKCSKLKDGEEWGSKRFNLHKPDGCDSVCVANWEEVAPTEDDVEVGKQERDKSKIVDQLEIVEFPMTAKDVATAIGKTPSHTTKLLNELFYEKKCEKNLKHPKKEPSSHNPWLYKALS